MLLRAQGLLQGHKLFAASIDEAIKTRSSRLSEIVNRIEVHAQQQPAAQKFSDVHEYLFVSARVYKMCTRSEEDRERIRASIQEFINYIPWKRMNDDQMARSLWSIATVGATPPNLAEYSISTRSFLVNKSFANVIWALARFSEAGNLRTERDAEALIAKMDPGRAVSLSNDELVSTIRALATIHQQ